MNLYALKIASRPILLRRPHGHLNRPHQITITKRQQQHTNSKPGADRERTLSREQEDGGAGTSIPVPATVAVVPIWQRLGPLSSAFSAYGRSQRKRPLLTQFLTSLVIYFCGDLAAQQISGEEYDAKRTVKALVISTGSSIPSYKWFIFLGNHFNYTSKFLSLLTKVAVNQLLFTPIFNTYFFGMQSLLSGDSLQEICTRIQRTVPISFVNSCKLWPAVTAFSFAYVSPQYRSIFAGFIAIGWQTYLSFLNRSAEEGEEVVVEGNVGEKEKGNGFERGREEQQVLEI